MKIDRKLIIVGLVFLILNILFINIYNPKFDGDDVGYFQIAENIINTGTFSFDGHTPTALRTPGYPLIVASALFLFKNIYAIYYLQTILLLLSGILGYLIYKEIFDNKYALIVFASIIFYPPLFLYTRRIISEIAFTFFILLTIYLFIKAYKSKSNILALITGISAGYLCLVRPSPTYFFILISSILILTTFVNLIKRKDKKKWLNLTLIILFICGFSLIYSPWVVRNYYAFEKIIPTTNINGIVGYFALHDNKGVSWDKGLTFNEPDEKRIYIDNISTGEVDRNERYTKDNIEVIKNNPVYALKRYVKNISYMLSLPDLYETLNQKISLNNSITKYFIILVLAMYILFYWSIWILWISFIYMTYIKYIKQKTKNNEDKFKLILIINLFVIYFISIHGITEGVRRYIVPIIPVIIIFITRYFFIKIENDKIKILR